MPDADASTRHAHSGTNQRRAPGGFWSWSHNSLGLPQGMISFSGRGSPGNCFGSGNTTFSKASSPARKASPSSTSYSSQSHTLSHACGFHQGTQHRPCSSSQLRALFFSLARGDNSPVLSSLPPCVQESIFLCRWSWAFPGPGANQCFKEAEASSSSARRRLLAALT